MSFHRDPPAQLDTVGISVPIRDADTLGATHTVVHEGTPEEMHTYRRKLDGGGFMAWGKGDVAWLEASLPKRLDPDGRSNVEAVNLDQAREALTDLHREAGNVVEFDQERDGHRVELARVVRLDTVRDFDDVMSTPYLLDGLSNVQVKGRAKSRRFADGDRNRAQTLTVGPMKAWAATLYDKHEETMGKAPPGRLRFEARLRKDVLGSQWAKAHGGNVVQLVDVTEEKMQTLRRGMFERVGFDREVTAMGRLVEVVNRAELSPEERRNLWAFLTLGPAGGDLGFSRPTERKYRRMAEDLGVVLADWKAPDVTIALDYDRGREVTRVAA